MDAQKTIRKIENLILEDQNTDLTIDKILMIICRNEKALFDKVAAILGERIHHNIVHQQLTLIFNGETPADAKIGSVLYILADGNVEKYNAIVHTLAA